jgi:hypothetical protein
MFRTSPRTRSPAARQVILSHAGYSLTRRLQETAKRINLGGDLQINCNTYNDNNASLRKLINLAALSNTAHGSVTLFRFLFRFGFSLHSYFNNPPFGLAIRTQIRGLTIPNLLSALHLVTIRSRVMARPYQQLGNTSKDLIQQFGSLGHLESPRASLICLKTYGVAAPCQISL